MRTRSLLLLILLPLLGCGDSAGKAGRIAHYWDDTVFSSETLLAEPELVEAQFADYLSLLRESSSTPEVAGASLSELLARAEADGEVFYLFWDLCEKYLYSPDSPVRDEELYRYALLRLIRSDRFDDYHKIRPRYQLNMIDRNRLGEPATDFEITLADDTSVMLHALQADYTILLFNNPDCPDCDRVRRQLERQWLVRLLEAMGRLRVVAVYSNPEEDVEAWRGSLPDYPLRWTMGYDAGAQLHYGGLYDLRGTPCLYLLDAHKRVLHKGASAVQPIVDALRVAIF